MLLYAESMSLPPDPDPLPQVSSPPPPLQSFSPVSYLPPPTSLPLSSLSSRRGRRKQNSARFQTQPITVDEVEMARNRRDGSSTPEAVIRPNQFLHSFSNDISSSFSKFTNLNVCLIGFTKLPWLMLIMKLNWLAYALCMVLNLAL